MFELNSRFNNEMKFEELTEYSHSSACAKRVFNCFSK